MFTQSQPALHSTAVEAELETKGECGHVLCRESRRMLYKWLWYYFCFFFFPQNKMGEEKLGVSKTFSPICSEIKGKKILGENKNIFKIPVGYFEAGLGLLFLYLVDLRSPCA